MGVIIDGIEDWIKSQPQKEHSTMMLFEKLENLEQKNY